MRERESLVRSQSQRGRGWREDLMTKQIFLSVVHNLLVCENCPPRLTLIPISVTKLPKEGSTSGQGCRIILLVSKSCFNAVFIKTFGPSWSIGQLASRKKLIKQTKSRMVRTRKVGQ